MGNRVKKIVYEENEGVDSTRYTYYQRDAAGDVLAVYELTTPIPLSGDEEICFILRAKCPPHGYIIETEVCTDSYIYNPITKVLTVNGPTNIVVTDCNFQQKTLVTPFTINMNNSLFVLGFQGGGSGTFEVANFAINQETPTTPQLAEWHLYGLSGRIGIRYPEKDVYYNQGFQPTSIFARNIRWKSYSLADHLGNIRVTFSDMKIVSGSNWIVDLTSASSFYPYGML